LCGGFSKKSSKEELMMLANNTIAYEKLIGRSLDDIAKSEEVVIFVSALTDVRMIVKCLLYLRIPFKVVEMGMSSIKDRVGFKRLCTETSWGLMPQIFINGQFIGGIDEFFEHPEIIPFDDTHKLEHGRTLQ
jgi:glutaredoxin-related protein